MPCFIDRKLEERFSEHAEADSLLGNAIRKYGAEKFSREVLAECETPEELDAQYRTLRDMSQKELAKRANMSVSSLSKIERGRYNDNVSVSLLFDIADGLQIDITMLVTFSDMKKSMWWKPISKD